MHMVVEAVFWFHPLVWWIGARLVQERELACDAEVLRLGSEPRVYADGILNVCKLYVESPLDCVAGVTGADIKKRIEVIMSNRIGLRLNFGKKLALAGAALTALAAPIVVGVMSSNCAGSGGQGEAGESAIGAGGRAARRS
jgi:beta-lactamase regulating signal transducer with metallopeptidase domain